MAKAKHGMKILELDIETAPNKVYTWGLFKQNVALNQIDEPGYTLCWAAKWYGEKEVMFSSLHHDDEYDMIFRMWELLDEADAVVHYNGTKFDMPTLNKEFVMWGLEPPTPYKEIDLYRTVRSRFRFPSNKLDFVSQQLGLGKKVPHKGMDLWRACMEGDDKAWATMKRYNIQDVKLLENLYKRLLPWIKGHPNVGLYVEDTDNPVCRNCGSTHVVKNGIERTTVQAYQRFRCEDCGTPQRGRLRLRKTPGGVLV